MDENNQNWLTALLNYALIAKKIESYQNQKLAFKFQWKIAPFLNLFPRYLHRISVEGIEDKITSNVVRNKTSVMVLNFRKFEVLSLNGKIRCRIGIRSAGIDSGLRNQIGGNSMNIYVQPHTPCKTTTIYR